MILHNPVADDPTRASDPFVTRYGGRYYRCYNHAKKVYVSVCDRLADLGRAEETCVWEYPGDTESWYAPELHHLDGRWYIYGAPAGLPGYSTHTMSALESVGDDPLGPYEFRGMLRGLENTWCIDGTVMEWDGRRYMVWSDSSLLIAEMSDPLTVSGKPAVLTSPKEPWETVMSPIAEGPCILQKDGHLHILYSASDSRCDDYCLALLTYRGGDVTDPANWEKSDGPVFAKTADIFGPGHCSVTEAVASDGTRTDVLVYHANRVSGTGWTGRSVWVQPFVWKSGVPVFGEPRWDVEI